MNELQRLLKPLKYKLLWERFCHGVIYMSMLTFGGGIVLAVLDKWWGFIEFDRLCIAMIGSMLFGGILLVFYPRRVDDLAVAQAGDSLGYHERFVTAMELLNKGETHSAMEQMAVEDGLMQARNNNLAKAYHIRIPKRFLKISAVLGLAFFIVGFIPSPNQKEVADYAEAYLKKVEQVENFKPEVSRLSKAERKEWNQIKKKMQKDMKKAKNKEAVDKAVMSAQQSMKKLEKNSVNKDLNRAGEVFAGDSMTKDLAMSMQKGNSQQLSQVMEQLMEELPTMTSEEKQQLAEIFKNAAGAVSTHELANSLLSLASQMNTEDMQAIAQGMNAMKEQLSKLAQQGEDMRQAMEALNQAMAQEKATQNQGEAGSSAENSTKNQEPSQEEGNQGSSGQEGAGAGQGGQGESNQGGNKGAGQGAGKGQGRGTGHAESEKIYTRKEQGKAGYETQLHGVQNENGQTTYSIQQTEGMKGESVPYKQVLESYKQEALRDLANDDIPYGMRKMVSEYFSSLEK